MSSLTEKELEERIKKYSAETFKEMAEEQTTKEPEEKVDEILKTQTNEYVKDQLKEHFDEAMQKAKQNIPVPSPEFTDAQKKANEFKDGKDFLRAVVRAKSGRGIDTRLSRIDKKGNIKSYSQLESETKTAGHMEIGDDTQGGYLAPEVYRADLWQHALENSVVRANGATVIPMTSDSLKIPYINDTDHSSTVFGGVSATWTAEAATKTATKPTFGQMELTPHKLAGITYASDELLDDSMTALEPLITRMFGSAWGYFEDDAFLVGTGVNQPLGIQVCNATINNLRNTANRVMIEDLAEMWMRLLPSSQGSAKWVINPTVIPELLELGSGNAADASGKNLVYINNAAEGPPITIWGRPVIVSEKMQALGTAGDIGQYGLDDKQLSSENSLNSGKAKSNNRYANPELSPLWESVETRQGASLWDEGIVQTTNTVH